MNSLPLPSEMVRNRTGLTVALAVVVALLLAAAGPIGLPVGYHDFADQSTLFGVPHAGDVLSNAPFLLVGLYGFAQLRSRARAAIAWRVFFIAIALTAFGSAWYHLAPSDARLAIDRLPIVWACAAMACAFGAERIDARWGQPLALAIALAVATITVPYAYLSPRWFPDGGDLRPYLLLQLWPLAIIPANLLVYRRVAPTALRNSAWLWPLALYLLAKLAEYADRGLLDLTGALSGHTIKHLLAAAAALLFALSLRTSTPAA